MSALQRKAHLKYRPVTPSEKKKYHQADDSLSRDYPEQWNMKTILPTDCKYTEVVT